MTISGYSNFIVDLMLGWIKGLANWVLRLFNLAGGNGASPLVWLSHNWLKLLVIFLVLGFAMDRLVWLIRWRPYWVWFRKERVIVRDEKFLAEDLPEDILELDNDDPLEEDWEERDYVVETRESRERAQRQRARTAPPTQTRRPTRRRTQAAERQRPSRSERPRRRPDDASVAETPRPRHRDAEMPATDSPLFHVDPNSPDVSDFYEDEVFNLESLPEPADYTEH